MGLLDDAIREHLDLKRQHGANEDELARQEAEALGPVTEGDVSGPQASVVDMPDGEREAGWPFDRVAENELADEPSFEWNRRGSDDVEVPSFVPAEPASESRPGEEPESVDMPTAAFDAVGPPVAGEEEELRFPDPATSLEEGPLVEDLDAGTVAAGPETEFLPPPSAEIGDRPEEPLEPDPSATELAADDLAEPGPEVHGSQAERSEPEPFGADPAEAEQREAGALPAETEEPLSEPEPLEPYPLGSVEPHPLPAETVPGSEPEPFADPGEPPLELDPSLDLPPEEEPPPAEPDALATEPPLLDETAEPPLGESPEAGSFGPPADLEPPLTGSESAVGPEPAAEQGSPPAPASAPLEGEAGPLTQAWSIDDQPGLGSAAVGAERGFAGGLGEDDLDPTEVAPIDERPVFEPLADAEDGPDDALDLPPDGLSGSGPVDADLDPAPVSAEEPPPGEPPAAARGFFEETEEHEMPGHEERPGADPDFEN
jgi:hypothetical protein